MPWHDMTCHSLHGMQFPPAPAPHPPRMAPVLGGRAALSDCGYIRELADAMGHAMTCRGMSWHAMVCRGMPWHDMHATCHATASHGMTMAWHGMLYHGTKTSCPTPLGLDGNSWDLSSSICICLQSPFRLRSICVPWQSIVDDGIPWCATVWHGYAMAYRGVP